MTEGNESAKRSFLRPRWLLVPIAAAALLGAAGICVYQRCAGTNTPLLPASFTGDTKQLKATQVVPTLDTPMEKGKNVIWCASFQLAWKKRQGLAGGTVVVKGAPPAMLSRLNSAFDPAPILPRDSYYANAGWANKGIVEQVVADMARLFPAKAAPEFPDILPDSYLAYAYLEANVPFTLPYHENDKPLTFTDGMGKKTHVHSFGLPMKDSDAYDDLRKQARIFYCEPVAAQDGSMQPVTGQYEECYFVIDPCVDSAPNQVIVAVVEPGATLGGMVEETEKIVAEAVAAHQDQSLESSLNATLLIPDIFWNMSHRYAELEEGMNVARQDISFRLDRTGARVKSESAMYAAAVSRFSLLLADRPFLVYMKKRGADKPFFVMWVDNAELLQKW